MTKMKTGNVGNKVVYLGKDTGENFLNDGYLSCSLISHFVEFKKMKFSLIYTIIILKFS